MSTTEEEMKAQWEAAVAARVAEEDKKRPPKVPWQLARVQQINKRLIESTQSPEAEKVFLEHVKEDMRFIIDQYAVAYSLSQMRVGGGSGNEGEGW